METIGIITLLVTLVEPSGTLGITAHYLALTGYPYSIPYRNPYGSPKALQEPAPEGFVTPFWARAPVACAAQCELQRKSRRDVNRAGFRVQG